VSGGQVSGDPDELTRAVRNILDNAERHARRLVRISLEETDGAVSLLIEDDGHGVPAAERERIFERFTRADEARSRDQGGSGLGLAITRDIVERHGGTIADPIGVRCRPRQNRRKGLLGRNDLPAICRGVLRRPTMTRPDIRVDSISLEPRPQVSEWTGHAPRHA
jgi:hypothetical protein